MATPGLSSCQETFKSQFVIGTAGKNTEQPGSWSSSEGIIRQMTKSRLSRVMTTQLPMSHKLYMIYMRSFVLNNQFWDLSTAFRVFPALCTKFEQQKQKSSSDCTIHNVWMGKTDHMRLVQPSQYLLSSVHGFWQCTSPVSVYITPIMQHMGIICRRYTNTIIYQTQ